MEKHLRLTFPQDQATQPVIYHLVKDFDVVPCIRRAAIENHFGWMILSLTGESEQITAAIAYLNNLGVEVSSPEGDIVAG
jgi:ABC-type methionine transport system ATPase subunit